MTIEAAAIQGRILIVDDEASMRDFLSICLRRAGHDVETAEGGEQAIQRIESEPFDLIVTDLRMQGTDGLAVVRCARSRPHPPEVLVVTAYATPESAIAALKMGSYDYLTKPFRVDDVLLGVVRALERRSLLRENIALRRKLQSRESLEQMVGKSPAMHRIFDLVRKVAPSRTSVLLLGESGTGKEMVARAIHQLSPRARGPFTAVNCGAIPEALLESELFGHVRGAFTGAVASRSGLFTAAVGGTLFLDEVAELPTAMQVKLLRAIQERKIKPVGAVEEQEVDLRIIAATNRDLALAVEEGRFREDLFYRLNVITIGLPPLRERREDIPALAKHFVTKIADEQKKPITGISPDALRILCDHDFPGNVRELENVIERAVTLTSAETLGAELFSELTTARAHLGSTRLALPEQGLNLDATVGEMERDLLCQALERACGVRADAARLLGITLRSLRYRLDKHGIHAGSDPTAPGDASTME